MKIQFREMKLLDRLETFHFFSLGNEITINVRFKNSIFLDFRFLINQF